MSKGCGWFHLAVRVPIPVVGADGAQGCSGLFVVRLSVHPCLGMLGWDWLVWSWFELYFRQGGPQLQPGTPLLWVYCRGTQGDRPHRAPKCSVKGMNKAFYCHETIPQCTPRGSPRDPGSRLPLETLGLGQNPNQQPTSLSQAPGLHCASIPLGGTAAQ